MLADSMIDDLPTPDPLFHAQPKTPHQHFTSHFTSTHPTRGTLTDDFLRTRTPDEPLGIPQDGHLQGVPRALRQILIVVPFFFGALDHRGGGALKERPGDQKEVREG